MSTAVKIDKKLDMKPREKRQELNITNLVLRQSEVLVLGIIKCSLTLYAK
jgi:hypothetical protein